VIDELDNKKVHRVGPDEPTSAAGFRRWKF